MVVGWCHKFHSLHIWWDTWMNKDVKSCKVQRFQDFLQPTNMCFIRVYYVKFFALFVSHICLILLQRRPKKWRRCHCNTLMTWSDVWRRCWGCGGFWWITNSTSLSPHCPRYNIWKIQYYPPPPPFKNKIKIITILFNLTFFCV